MQPNLTIFDSLKINLKGWLDNLTQGTNPPIIKVRLNIYKYLQKNQMHSNSFI